jgi:hypothetical protein
VTNSAHSVSSFSGDPQLTAYVVGSILGIGVFIVIAAYLVGVVWTTVTTVKLGRSHLFQYPEWIRALRG